MTWTPPVFGGGVVWQDEPSLATPLSAHDLNTSETLVAQFATSVGSSVVGYFESGQSPAVPTIDTVATDIQMNGVQAAGSVGKAADAGHVHPTDTTRAPLASPVFTGAPSAPSPANADSSTKLATTAWVAANTAGGVTLDATATDIQMDGVRAAGAVGKAADAGHVHPTDTSRAPLVSPTLTGTPLAPTAAGGTNNTQIATTAFVEAAVGAAGTLPEVTLESLGAVGDGTTDDTAAFQAAAKLGAVRITGGHSSYKVTGEISLYTDAGHNAQGSYWDLWGITVTTTNNTAPGAALFTDRSSQDGTTFRSRITFAGGHFIGPGQGTTWNAFNNAFVLYQWQDVQIIGCEVEQFNSGAGLFSLCKRVRVAFTTIHDICTVNQYNAWNASDGISNGTVNGLKIDTAFILIGNYCYDGAGGIPTAPIAYNSQWGNVGNYHVIVANNTLLFTGTTGIFNEVNSYNAGVGQSYVARVMITDNIINNASTSAAATCLYVSDDGGTKETDPAKLDAFLIQHNLMVYASNAGANAGNAAIWLVCSHTRVSGNLVFATGTSGRCLAMKPGGTDTAAYTDLSISDNDFYQNHTSTLSASIWLSKITNWRITGGKLKSNATAAGSQAHAIHCEATATQGFIGGGIVIDTPGNNGIDFTTMTDITVDGFRIHNPNGSSAGAGANANGISLQSGGAAGTTNVIQNGTIVDDRGTHQMQFSIYCGGSNTTPARVKNAYGNGHLSGLAFNSGSLVTARYAEVWGWSGDMGNFTLASQSISANPTVIPAAPYDQQFILTALGGATNWSYQRLAGGTSTSLGTPIAQASIIVRRGDTLTVTGSTTATGVLIPMP